jgi:hypothetical protein
MKNNVESDPCVFCGTELSLWERTRCYCWNCGDFGTDTYDEEVEELNG